MNVQISKIERQTLEKNFQSNNFDKVEKNLHSLFTRGYKNVWLYSLLAVSYAKQKKFKEAEVTFLKIIELEPNDFDHYFNLANLYKETKAYDKCINTLQLALKVRPSDKKALILLGANYYQVKNYKKAIHCANFILEKYPLSIESLNLKAISDIELGKFKEAIDCFTKIVSLKGEEPGILSDIAACYIFSGDLTNAKKFIQLSGNNIGARYNNSLIDLTYGEYLNGWKEFELGLKNNSRNLKKGSEKFKNIPDFDPKVHKRSILLIGEQGIGDEIMYSTIIGDLSKKVKKIFLYCDNRLELIFKDKFPFLEFVDNNYNLNNIESKLPIGSLARIFRNYEKDFYDNLEKNLITECNSNLLKLSSRINIGLSWHTENLQFGPERNINLNSLIPIFENKKLNFINLQYGNHEYEINNLETKIGRKIFLKDSIDNKNDIYGLAKKIKKCDLVITIDNSTVHLAGFLNKKTFLLLPFVADWRWQLHRNDTPWYNSVKLFRQSKKFEWDPVISKIRKILERL
jgi:tetratricopeptide (TPR) repeat protein